MQAGPIAARQAAEHVHALERVAVDPVVLARAPAILDVDPGRGPDRLVARRIAAPRRRVVGIAAVLIRPVVLDQRRGAPPGDALPAQQRDEAPAVDSGGRGTAGERSRLHAGLTALANCHGGGGCWAAANPRP